MMWKWQNRKWTRIFTEMQSSVNPRDTWIRLDNEINVNTMWELVDDIYDDEMSIHSADRRVDDKESDYMQQRFRSIAKHRLSDMGDLMQYLPPIYLQEEHERCICEQQDGAGHNDNANNPR